MQVIKLKPHWQTVAYWTSRDEFKEPCRDASSLEAMTQAIQSQLVFTNDIQIIEKLPCSLVILLGCICHIVSPAMLRR
jgi:hypothetical protein